jgi:hypothetical protein
MFKVLLIALLLTLSAVVLPQDGTPSAPSSQESAAQIDELTTDEFDNPPTVEGQAVTTMDETARQALEYRLTQEEYIFKEVVILAIMAAVSLLIVLTFMKINGACKPRDMVITAGLILIIFSTVILVLVADTQEQISAAIGVLGAIAGYLFGTASSRLADSKEHATRDEARPDNRREVESK